MLIKFFAALICALTPAAALAGPKLNRVVLGYSAVWRDASIAPADYEYEGFTYLARAFLDPQPDGSISVPEGYFSSSLESRAHAHGVKLLMSLGGGSGGSARWLSIANNPQNLKNLLDQLQRLMTEHHYDGIDIDWEPPPETMAQGEAYTSLLKAMRQRFPQAVITTALTTAEYAIKFFSWPDVIGSVDYVNVMSYDYSGPWSGKAGYATNLSPPTDYPPLPEHSVVEGMQNLIEHHHVPPAKLLLGFNFWAYRFRADRVGDSFPKNAEAYNDTLSYQQVLDLMNTGHYQSLWDQGAMAPYLQRSDGGSVIVYDNPESIRRKCEYAEKLHCAGTMVWNVGSDECGSRAPLMDVVIQFAGGQPNALSRTAMENQITDTFNLIQRDQKLMQPYHDQHPDLPSITHVADSLPSLAALSVEQLETLFGRLQQSWAELNDQLWKSQDPRALKR